MLHVTWSAYEMLLDCLLTDLLGLSDAAGHYVTAGMDHQRRVKTARTLLKRSDRSNASAIREKIGAMAKQHKRNVLIHAYVTVNSEKDIVTFISRRMNDDYECQEYVFTVPELIVHIGNFSQENGDLQNLCGYSNERLDAFCRAALKASASS